MYRWLYYPLPILAFASVYKKPWSGSLIKQTSIIRNVTTMVNCWFRSGWCTILQGFLCPWWHLCEMVLWSRLKKSSQQWNGILPKNDKTDLSVSIFCNSVLERTPFWTSRLYIRTNLPEFLRKNLPCSPGKLSKIWHKVVWVGLKQKHRWGKCVHAHHSFQHLLKVDGGEGWKQQQIRLKMVNPWLKNSFQS